MQNILFHFTKEDTNYIPRLKPLLQGRAKVSLTNHYPNTVYDIIIKAKAAGSTQVCTTSARFLQLLLGMKGEKLPSLDDYAGSMFERSGIEILILPPCEQLVTTNTGVFLYKRYLDKFLAPEKFIQIPQFTWTLWTPQISLEIYNDLHQCNYISVDIETVRDDPDRSIDCIGFTGITLSKQNIYTLYTCVVPMDTIVGYDFIAKVLKLAQPKIFQNGKYDNNYLLRYRLPVTNYAFDTINLFHSWYSELPKRLDFITAFMIRKWQFWKDQGKSGNLMDYYEYNARDCFTTAIDFLALMQEMPQWAIDNFVMEMPIVYPCLLAEMTGLKRDNEVMEAENERFLGILAIRLRRLRTMVGNSNFNPSSPKQVQKLFIALGSQDITSTSVQNMDKVMFRHPLNRRILQEIIDYRKDRKLQGTYLQDENPETGEKKTWHGRIFFSISPSGTDTGRLASKESSFWCGWQIQNIPRDRSDIQVKRGIVSDPGYYFFEIDFRQNEARGTAYLSGDVNLIKAVDDVTKDFHGTNASAFFGIPYEKIVKSTYDVEQEEWLHKTLDKLLRDLSKRTNHGANYNMGPQVMLDTMGIRAVLKAKELLNLPRHWGLLQVTSHLLDVFAKTYPILKGPWYEKIITDVLTKHMLVGPTGWTRYCFGKPDKSKRDLNTYVAHPPQSLAAMVLNKAYNNIFQNVILPANGAAKLGPQIHDSVLGQYKIGRLDIVYAAAKCMDIPVVVKDTFGIERTLRVPVDVKGESNHWSELKEIRLPKGH